MLDVALLFESLAMGGAVAAPAGLMGVLSIRRRRTRGDLAWPADGPCGAR
jgi:hypothetical protein